MSAQLFSLLLALNSLAQDFSALIPKFWPLHLALEMSVDVKDVWA